MVEDAVPVNPPAPEVTAARGAMEATAGKYTVTAGSDFIVVATSATMVASVPR